MSLGCYGCNFCNRCGKVDRMIAEQRKGRTCPRCKEPLSESDLVCPHCKLAVPRRSAPPGVQNA